METNTIKERANGANVLLLNSLFCGNIGITQFWGEFLEEALIGPLNSYGRGVKLYLRGLKIDTRNLSRK